MSADEQAESAVRGDGAAVLAALRPDLDLWASLWGLPGFRDRLAVSFSGRLRSSLGRATPRRRDVRLHAGLVAAPLDLVREILCHEAAHVAAWELHGEGIRPHGREWAALVRAAGYRPSTRLRVPDGLLPPPPARRRRRNRYLYDHRCPSCGWRRPARAAVRRWRCPRCVDRGGEGRLEIWRTRIG